MKTCCQTLRTRLNRATVFRVQAVVADRRLAERAKWKPYAGAAPTGQAIAAMRMPCAHQLAYLLRRARLASSVHAEPKAAPLRHCRQATPSPSSFATVKTPLPASPRLHRHPLELVHLATETVSQGRRHFFFFSAADRHCHRSRSCARHGRPPPELYHSFLPLPSVSL